MISNTQFLRCLDGSGVDRLPNSMRRFPFGTTAITVLTFAFCCLRQASAREATRNKGKEEDVFSFGDISFLQNFGWKVLR